MEKKPINNKLSSFTGNLVMYHNIGYKIEILFYDNEDIIIRCFNIDTNYQNKFTFNDFISKNNYFKENFNTAYEIYRELNDNILKNISIKLIDENSLTLLLLLNENNIETIPNNNMQKQIRIQFPILSKISSFKVFSVSIFLYIYIPDKTKIITCII